MPEITNEPCTCRGAVAKTYRDSIIANVGGGAMRIYRKIRRWARRRAILRNCPDQDVGSELPSPRRDRTVS